MRAVLETIETWVQRGDPVTLATVVATKKSAPQPVGTKMLTHDPKLDDPALTAALASDAGGRIHDVVLA